MPDAVYVLKSKRNFIFIGLMLIGAVFFAYWANGLWQSPVKIEGASVNTGKIIRMIFFGGFAIFSAGCLYGIISLKTYVLTDEQLVISRPMFFSKNRLLLNDIAGFSEKDETISVSRGLSYENYSIGHKTIVRFKNGQQTIISSLEIWNYRAFMKKLQSEVRSKS